MRNMACIENLNIEILAEKTNYNKSLSTNS